MEPRFGVSLTAAPGEDVVAQARRAESLGFDLVTVTDHLHGKQPVYETWTALTWVAASTERIRVAPDVLALPYRSPAVVAKMAESLDRLSAGRLVLALGGGGNDAAFRAFGLPQRSPGEKVEALYEALQVIRGLWSAESFSFEGRHFTVRQARIEPRPERAIPIWLGVYGNRMLELVGTLADGWLPSRYYLDHESAVEKMDRIKKAAADAGRDPDTFEFAYNVWVRVEDGAAPKEGQVAGGPDRVAEELAGFLRSGFTLLNLWASGDPTEQWERLAQEVIPSVRRAVG